MALFEKQALIYDAPDGAALETIRHATGEVLGASILLPFAGALIRNAFELPVDVHALRVHDQDDITDWQIVGSHGGSPMPLIRDPQPATERQLPMCRVAVLEGNARLYTGIIKNPANPAVFTGTIAYRGGRSVDMEAGSLFIARNHPDAVRLEVHDMSPDFMAVVNGGSLVPAESDQTTKTF